MKKNRLFGLQILALGMLVSACVEPKFAEETAQTDRNAGVRLRPSQAYAAFYEEEVLSVKPRIRGSILAKGASEAEAPILTRYEKAMVVENWDSTGRFSYEKTFVDGTYEGKAFAPSKRGEPGPGEIKESEFHKGMKVRRLVINDHESVSYLDNGEVKRTPIPDAVLTEIERIKQETGEWVPSTGPDTTGGLNGKWLEQLEKSVTRNGGTLSINNKNQISAIFKQSQSDDYLHILMDGNTGMTLQEALYVGGSLSLLTKYAYTEIGNRFFPVMISTRLFDRVDGRLTLISETMETRNKYRIMPK
ncbi:MAG: hypothetical protein HUU10_13920 [Bacteroidetes bacterium]|nr:hypothetical protein [Bacteroidota bacterium]